MIEARTRTTYFSPLAGRHFLTLRAAAHNEASAMVRKKYPTEPFEQDTGAGWRFEQDDRLVKLRDRMRKILMRKFREP